MLGRTALLAACCGLLGAGGSGDGEGVLDYDFSGRGSPKAVAALLRRVLQLAPDAELPFVLELVKECSGEPPAAAKSKLCFELRDDNSLVKIAGTSGVDIARGAAHYLRTFCNMSFSWARSGGDQVVLPKAWPRVGEPIVQWRLRDISYGFNVCTFSYSNVWYGFDAHSPGSELGETWEHLIDWMALSGINLALAYTGQEEVYRKAYEHFGVNASAFAEWSNGPAHLTWSRGQSMHNIGGPLPLSWMKSQWHLQRKILRRMRELGMVPVLPAFQGNVPPLLAKLKPGANITIQASHWGGGRAAWLDATDPLFQAIGDRFMQQTVADFGIDKDGDGIGDETDHWYEADGYFAAGNPPWLATEKAGRPVTTAGYDENAYVHASKAFLAMNTTDPDAMWLYQGWILQPDAHSQAVMRGYAAAVPKGRLLVSDMWAEWRPITGMLAGAGVPYLYGVLQNFGGTLYMGMSTVAVNSGAPEAKREVPSVFETFASRAGGMGVGAFPEGIDQNPAYFTFLFDTNWMAGPANLSSWWHRYAVERYGKDSASAASAWQRLAASVYGVDERRGASEGGFWREKSKGGLLSSPLLYDASDTPSHDWYKLSEVLEAWRSLVAAADELGGCPGTLRYDLANVGRELLDKLANGRFARLAAAKTEDEVQAAGKRFLELLQDADGLLCSYDGLSLHSWLEAARSLGKADGGLADYYESQARAQVTTWLPACEPGQEESGICSVHRSKKPPPLEDYANKAWGGLVGQYYSARVKCYLQLWQNITAYDVCVDQLNLAFQKDMGRQKFPICKAPVGDTLALSRALIAKYGGEVPPASILV